MMKCLCLLISISFWCLFPSEAIAQREWAPGVKEAQDSDKSSGPSIYLRIGPSFSTYEIDFDELDYTSHTRMVGVSLEVGLTVLEIGESSSFPLILDLPLNVMMHIEHDDSDSFESYGYLDSPSDFVTQAVQIIPTVKMRVPLGSGLTAFPYIGFGLGLINHNHGPISHYQGGSDTMNGIRTIRFGGDVMFGKHHGLSIAWSKSTDGYSEEAYLYVESYDHYGSYPYEPSCKFSQLVVSYVFKR